MTNSGRNLRVVNKDDKPVYPIPYGERLASHSFFPFHYDRFLNSDFILDGAEWDVQAVALTLWCKSQYQNPVGTLPDDDQKLAALVGVSSDEWAKFKRRVPSPMHGWKPCFVQDRDGKLRDDKGPRLMHDVVAEVAYEALGFKEKNAEKNLADKERQALTRLRKVVASLGNERLSKDEMYIVMLHQWLDENYPTGYRTSPRVVEGMHALGTRKM